MSLVSFPSLPDGSRIWCFGASRPPDGAETAHLLDSMQTFVEEWTAHDRDLRAGMSWREHRFLLIGVDETRADASGCSIDALTRQIRGLEARLGLELLDSRPVWYRDTSGRVRSCSRDDFRVLAHNGGVSEGTRVFDLSLTRLQDYRDGAFEKPASESWHRSLLRRE